MTLLAVSDPSPPTGPLYSWFLVGHLACFVVGSVALAVSAVQGGRLRRVVGVPAGSPPESLKRYYRPGPAVMGRTIHGVPLFGFALLGASRGTFDVSDFFVIAGLVIWVAAAAVAEAVVFPAERDIHANLNPAPVGANPVTGQDLDQAGTREVGPHADGDPTSGVIRAPSLGSLARRAERGGWVVVALFVVAAAVMVIKP